MYDSSELENTSEAIYCFYIIIGNIESYNLLKSDKEIYKKIIGDDLLDNLFDVIKP